MNTQQEFFYNTVRPVHLWIMKPTFKQSYEYSMNCSGVNSFTKLHIPQDLTVYYTNLILMKFVLLTS